MGHVCWAHVKPAKNRSDEKWALILMSLSAFTAIMKYWWDHTHIHVVCKCRRRRRPWSTACAPPESARSARLCGASSSNNEQLALLLLYICICHRNGRAGALKKVFLFFVATPLSAAPATLFSLCVLYDFDYILLLFLVYLFRFCQIAYRDEPKGRFLGFA